MQYFYRPNGNVEFRPFHENNTVDNEQRENKNVLQKSDDTHSHKQSEYKQSEGSTENMNHTNIKGGAKKTQCFENTLF